MSAAELRKAAETLRGLAAACEPAAGDDTSASWTDEYDAKAHEREHGYYSADVAYIAKVGPDVGLALADWLDDAAARWYHHIESASSVTLARLINGGAA